MIEFLNSAVWRNLLLVLHCNNFIYGVFLLFLSFYVVHKDSNDSLDLSSPMTYPAIKSLYYCNQGKQGALSKRGQNTVNISKMCTEGLTILCLLLGN